MLRSTPTPATTTTWMGGVYQDKQRLRLLVAVIVLLAAITAILIRNYESGLSSENGTDAAASDQPAYSPSAAGPPPVAPGVEARTPVAASQGVPAASSRTRTGQAHSIGHAASASVKRGNAHALGADTARASAAWGPATTAAQQSRSSDQTQARQRPPSYPLLTRATAVQGSVLLQALIAADGAVQEMRVISGPAILVSAARQAVQQWRFKPFLQNGKPVETYARVTVNFTIDVSNTEARYRVNSVTSNGAL